MAESTMVTGYIPRRFTRPQTVTHPGTNRVWRSATTLIEANALPLRKPPTIQHSALIIRLISVYYTESSTLQ